MILREALFLLTNSCKLISLVYKDHSAKFGQEGNKIGDTLRVRKPARYIGGDGPAFEPEAMTEDYLYAKMDKWSKVHMSFDSAELFLSLDDFSNRHLKPAAKALANKLDRAMAQVMSENIYNCIGVPGTLPDELRTYLQAGQKLTEMGCPEDMEKYMVINAASRVEIIDALKGLFQDSAEVGRQYRSGRMGKTGGYTWYEDENLIRHTNGTYVAQGLVNGGTQTGSSLITDGWGTGAASLKKGDVFTIANVYAVNPQHRQSTGALQQFVVTQDIADTAGAITIPISPAIIPAGQFQNVDSIPADNAQITILGASGAIGPDNLCFIESAFGFVSAPLPKSNVGECWVETDPVTGVSMRYLRQHSGAAVISAGAPPTDAWITRLDVLWGAYPIYPELAVRVRG